MVVTDPGDPDVVALLEGHLSFAAEHSPPEDVHALDLDGLRDPSITFLAARRDGVLLGVGALKVLDPTHGELKSMHTLAASRGSGVGAALVRRLLDEARALGLERVSLETGSMEAFAPARRMYARAGFVACEPFGDYNPSRNSTFMTLDLSPDAR
ncbi:GNAT family N-acetyltransferase [Nocardioides iriomotensis]|uniref:GNAT family N-acetyltransferase n=2 Tax=Nocardioides iriomotensis TaxID=715784 RepID=A0A4Q5J2G8_9ACTN|nr:GNAT family N-acetyltransferase [Nocardioides iriomotensis]